MIMQRRHSELAHDLHFSVQSRGIELKNLDRRTIRRILASSLKRFSRRVRTIRIWLEDVNGPRGGKDIRCRMDVHFRPHGYITVSDLAIDEYKAIAKAAARAREVIDRRVKRLRSRQRELVRHYD